MGMPVKNKVLTQLKRLSSMMGQEGGCEIRFGGNQAFFDPSGGKNGKGLIVFPAGDFSDPDYLTLINGLSDHENGHCQFTERLNHNAFDGYSNREIKWINSFRNLFEDIRMEKLVINKYPGARKNLVGTVSMAIKRGFFQEPQDTPHVISAYYLYGLRSEELNQTELSAWSELATQYTKNQYGSIFGELEAIFEKAKHTTSNKSCLALSKELYELLKDNSEDDSDDSDDSDDTDSDADGDSDDSDDSDDTNSDAGGDSDDSDDSDDTDSDADGDSDDSDDSGDTNSDAGGDSDDSDDSDDTDSDADGDSDDSDDSGDANSDAGGDSDDSDGSGDANSDAGGDSDSDGSSDKATIQACLDALDASSDELPKDLHDALNQMLEEMAEEAANNIDVPPLSTISKVDPSYYQANYLDQAMANRLSRPVKNTLLKSMFEQNKTERKYAERGRRLVGNQLSRISTGCKEVFVEESRNRAPNAAVTLLVDRSTSMNWESGEANGNSMRLANTSALAISKALSQIKGVTNEVGYFPARSSSNDCSLAKSFAQRQVDPKEFELIPTGSTPVAGAIMQFALRLLAQESPIKTMFVVTDGEPNNEREAIAALQFATDNGINVYILGIGEASKQPSIAQLYKDFNFQSVTKIESLNQVVSDLMKG